MAESLHDFVVENLQLTKGTWRRISEATSVNYKTLTNIARREYKSPGVENIEKLAKYFREHRVN